MGTISGNTFDRNAPGVYYGVNAGQVTLGSNSWPATGFATTAATSSSTTLTVALAAGPAPSYGGIVAGQNVIGAGVPAGTTVASVSGTTVTLSQAATVANGAALTFPFAYYTNMGASLIAAPAHPRVVALTLANGDGTYTYDTGIGTTPLSPFCTLLGNSNYMCNINGINSNGTLSLQMLSRTSGSAAPNGSYAVSIGD